MPETSRECIVSLPDDTSFTVPVKPTLLGSELLDMAASHCKVKEKEYFGLLTEGEGYKNWLELDKPVLDPSQDLPKSIGPVKIYFCFKFFPSNLHMIQDFMTVDLLYFQCRQQIMKGEIVTDPDTLYELAAHALQASHGEYKNDSEALQHLQALPVLPVHLFKSCSVQSCESAVVEFYKMMQTYSRGEAIFKYLEIVLSLPMYAIHYYDVKWAPHSGDQLGQVRAWAPHSGDQLGQVRAWAPHSGDQLGQVRAWAPHSGDQLGQDKKDVELCLGVGYEGVSEYSVADKNEPLSRYQWLQLQNIYYKDKKFAIEVSTKGVDKASSKGTLKVVTWYASTPKLVMAIWKMARDQHMFHRSTRSKSQMQEVYSSSTAAELKRQLNKHHHASLSPSSSQSSLSIESSRSTLTQASAEAMAAAKAAQNEMYTALQNRRQSLVQEFEQKAAYYKSLLIKEMQITSVPPEGLAAEEIEKMRKKFGVNYKFSKFVLDESGAADGGGEVEELERQLEVHSAIIDAEKNLMMQAKNSKLKKDRKKNVKQLSEKYHKLEERLNDLKQSPSRPRRRRRASSPSHPATTLDDSCLAQMIFSDGSSPGQRNIHHRSTSALSDQAPRSAATLPAVHSSTTLRQLDFDSSESPNSSFSAYDDFDEVSTPSSLHGGAHHPATAATSYHLRPHQQGVGVVGGGGTSKSMGTLRDFDLAEDMLEHLAQNGDSRSVHSIDGTSSRSGHRYHQSMGTGRYDNSPTMGLPYGYQDGHPMSPDVPEGSPDCSGGNSPHPYQQGGVVLRGGGTGPRSGRGQLGYGEEVGGAQSSHRLHPNTARQRPHARTGSDEQYDIQEMLTIWNESPSNPFEVEGTLV
ncbi:hypothetical protein EMCRGX_G027211 [Ephydatia muelleri]